MDICAESPYLIPLKLIHLKMIAYDAENLLDKVRQCLHLFAAMILNNEATPQRSY